MLPNAATNSRHRCGNCAAKIREKKRLAKPRAIEETEPVKSFTRPWMRWVPSALILLCTFGHNLPAADTATKAKPVLLYSRYFNAEGESRYLPDGTCKDVLGKLRGEFEVRVHHEALTAQNLSGVNVVLVLNPSDKAVGSHPAPPHFTAKEIAVLTAFVEQGGGFIIMGNQENHNFEVEDTNHLLAHFGLQFTNLYTDVKKLVVPKDAPLIGGLNWGYYTGNLLTLTPNHAAKPRAVVVNDLQQKPLKGPRDTAGVLLAIAEPGQGRVVAVTDAGWITNTALNEEGIGGVAVKGQDNWEILRRLTRWAAHAP